MKTQLHPLQYASFDPVGKPVGVKEIPAEELSARDIDAIKNPLPDVDIAVEPPSAKGLEDMARDGPAKSFMVQFAIRETQTEQSTFLQWETLPR